MEPRKMLEWDRYAFHAFSKSTLERLSWIAVKSKLDQSRANHLGVRWIEAEK